MRSSLPRHASANPLGHRGTDPSRETLCAGRKYVEGGHQLEKLQFALAVAESRGDRQRSLMLRREIDRLGGNQEEPGT